MMDIDIAVTQNEFGKFDISFGPDGDLTKTEGFDTAITMSLFCERRASAAEVTISSRRRGWWGNIASRIEDFEIGSKLWQVEQERLTPDVLSRIKDHVARGLAWLVTEGFAVDTQTDVVRLDGSVRVDVTIERPNGQVERVGYDIWQQTGITA